MRLPIYFCEVHFVAKTKRRIINRSFESPIVLDAKHHTFHDKEAFIKRQCYRYLVTPAKGLEKILEQYEISVTFKKLFQQGYTVWEAQEESVGKSSDI